MGGKFEQTKPPKPRVPAAPHSRKAAPPAGEGMALNRQQRRAAARGKKPVGPAGGPIGLPAPDAAESNAPPANVPKAPANAAKSDPAVPKTAPKPKKPAK